MNRIKYFLTGVFTIALGFGVWTLAVNFSPISSSFAPGDTVSAADFNTLFSTIDANFDAAKAAIDANDSDIAALQTDVTGLQGDVTGLQSDVADLQSNKVSVSGDTMTGQLKINGDTGAPDFLGSGESNAALDVINTNPNGIGVYIESTGVGVPLLVKNTGTGPVFAARGPSSHGLVVSNDGDLQLGVLFGAAINPTITLDAETGDITLEGTIKNPAGNQLIPIAYGVVDSAGTIVSGTDNWSVSWSGSILGYLITIDGEDYSRDYVTVVTPFVGPAYATTNDSSTFLIVKIFDENDNRIQNTFQFVTYKTIP